MNIQVKFSLIFLFVYFANASDLDPIVGIVGGRYIDIKQAPWQAHIRFVVIAKIYGSYNKISRMCCGSIIHEKWILSAAHCSHIEDVRSATVRVGTSYSNNGGQIYHAKRIINHGRYDGDSLNYDIALLELANAIKFDYLTVKAIPLPNAYYDHISVHKMCFVSGWGKDSMYGQPTILKGVELPLVSNAECQQAHHDMKITETMMCAGFKNGGRDSCSGDSGGPMVCTSIDGKLKLFGVVSWGSPQCGLANVPGVYSRVQAVRLWIKKNTGV